MSFFCWVCGVVGSYIVIIELFVNEVKIKNSRVERRVQVES